MKSGLIASHNAAEALAIAAQNAPTTEGEARAQIEAKRRGASSYVRAKEGETIEETMRRSAQEERAAKEAKQQAEIERATDLSVNGNSSNVAFQSEVTRYHAVPPLEQMVIKIDGNTEVPFLHAQKYVEQGMFTAKQVHEAVLAEGRAYDPKFNIPMEALGKR